MNKKPFSYILIFWSVFIFPIIIYFIYSLYLTKNNNQHFFHININNDYQKIFLNHIVKSMKHEINTTTIEIILMNVFVMFVLWGVVFILWGLFLKDKDYIDKYQQNKVFRYSYIAFIFFFFKEGIRVGSTVLDFYQTVQIPFLPSFITLILPHAIFEFTAFMAVSVFALKWLQQVINTDNKFVWPNHIHIIVPIFLLISAATVETTLTPYLFKLLVSYYI